MRESWGAQAVEEDKQARGVVEEWFTSRFNLASTHS